MVVFYVTQIYTDNISPFLTPGIIGWFYLFLFEDEEVIEKA
jgi:hypothetical protein